MREELRRLRARMEACEVDACYIPTADYHGSEYVDEFFKCRAYVSGFTGSAGTLVVLAEKAGLWTDGRYFLQAEEQLAGSGITLFRAGEPGVPEVTAFLEAELSGGAVLAMDGRVVDAGTGEKLEKILQAKQGTLRYDLDLVGDIWENRPAMRMRGVIELDTVYTGRSREEKLVALREEMQKSGADHHILTSLDDIAWLLNIRGDDVENNPVSLAFLIVGPEDVRLFAKESAFESALKEKLEAAGVLLRPYDCIYEAVAQIPEGACVLLEKGKINYRLLRSMAAGVTLSDRVNSTTAAKAVKTAAEIEGMRACHLRDGAALTRFLRWLKKHVGKETITEISASVKLEEFRKQDPSYRGPSFETIAGYKEHGAIIHYSATEASDKELAPEGMLLLDSGGQYWGGTTDVTRTVVLGPISEAARKHYTMTVVAMLRLADAKFPAGTNGACLDVLARQIFWKAGLDYRHGTGHGVGSFLNVHEGPNSINWRGRGPEVWKWQPGMVTSDEPGYYAKGEYGIRIENLILCKEEATTEYGTFYGFEPLTWVPIDLDGLAPELMTEEDIVLLNRYHEQVREKLSPLLSKEEGEWLKEATAPVRK